MNSLVVLLNTLIAVCINAISITVMLKIISPTFTKCVLNIYPSVYFINSAALMNERTRNNPAFVSP